MNNIILLATYWNERDWIEASLAQIEVINPVEVIICDGCFDPKFPNRSTDGTREILQKWVAQRKNATLISAIRLPKVKGAKTLLNHQPNSKPIRLLTSLSALRKSVYRINQAITFNYMAAISNYWRPGRWFMTMDADQFYSDEMIEQFKEVCNSETEFGLLTGHELTFFTDFNRYTSDYEKRVYNNMPHKIYPNTFIKPTRGIIREYPFTYKYYIDDVPAKSVGSYFHYKLKPRSPDRYEVGYRLGDRKTPQIDTYTFHEFHSKHPSIIQEFFLT